MRVAGLSDRRLPSIGCHSIDCLPLGWASTSREDLTEMKQGSADRLPLGALGLNVSRGSADGSPRAADRRSRRIP